ncbi:PAS sensor protein [Desulforamulus ruminis DSM 2154]|uniref:histidine kinase n=2 Tax=Desulforamulus ruminis TaxID=1564 RepID=F6DKX5_DESRL|nr:PAS sensor protein [Desulforamulus ruminis DSM 2154]
MIRRFSKASIKSKLITLVLVIIMPVILLLSYTFSEYRKVEVTQAQENTKRLVTQATENYNRTIKCTKQMLQLLALNPQVLNIDWSNELYRSLLAEHPEYSIIGMLDVKGNLICSAPQSTEPLNFFARPAFQRALQTGRFSIGEYYVGPITGQTVITFCYPVMDHNGKVNGVLFTGLKLSYLTDIAWQYKLPEGSSLTLCDGKGKILARFPDNDRWTGRTVPEALRDAVVKGNVKSIQALGVDGTERIYSFTPLSSFPNNDRALYIYSGIPKHVVYTTSNGILQKNITVIIIVTLASVALILISGTLHLLRPLNNLVKVTKELSSANLNVRTNLPYDGEIGLLAKSFDEMIISLEKYAKKLENAERKYKSLVEQLPVVVYLSQLPDQKPIYINPYLHKVLGFFAEEWLGKPKIWMEYIFIEDKERVEEEFRNSVANKTDFVSEYRMVHRNGQVVWVQEHAELLFDEEGKSYAIQGIMQDITERKRYENELIKLDRLNLIGEMAAGISHEVRNPMTTIRGFLQMLREKESRYKSYYDLMIEELDRANLIITEFLSIGRSKPTGLEVQNLNHIISSLIPLIKADAANQDKNLQIDISEIPDILLNENEIRQLILNLCRNGLEAMQQSGGYLTIRTYRDPNHLVLVVQDQGEGIKPEYLEKLGTPFFTTKDYGTGLGLGICYSIAARHNATISIDTGPKGTTFYVKFECSSC